MKTASIPHEPELSIEKPVDNGAWRFIIFLIACLLYANAVPNDYGMDDYLVTNNHYLTSQGIRSIPTIITSPYYEDNAGYAYGYRPITHITFALQNEIFFGDIAWVSHLVNVLLYGLCCLFLFRVLILVFSTTPFLALLSTLLFLFHPLHTEVAANIKNRDELLMFLFGVAAIRRYLLFLEGYRWQQISWFIVFTALSLLCKPTAIALYFILPVFVFAYRPLADVKRTYFFSTLPVAISILLSNGKIPNIISAVFGMIPYVFFISFLFRNMETKSLFHHLKGLIVGSKEKLSVFFNGYYALALLLPILVLFAWGVLYFWKVNDRFLFIGIISMLAVFSSFPNVLGRASLYVTSLFTTALFFILAESDLLLLAGFISSSCILSREKKVDFIALFLTLSSMLLFIMYSQPAAWFALYRFLVIPVYYLTLQNSKFSPYFFSSVLLITSGTKLLKSKLGAIANIGGAACILMDSYAPLRRFRFFPFYLILFWFTYTYDGFELGNTRITKLFISQQPTKMKEVETINLTGRDDRPLRFLENPIAFEPSVSKRIASAVAVTGRYLSLIVFPYPLRYYYGYSVEGTHSWDEAVVIFSLLAILLLLAALLFLKRMIPAFGILILLLALAPFSNLLFPLPGVVAERYAFISTIGYSVLLAYITFILATKIHPKKATTLVLVSPIIIAMVIWVLIRNTQWENTETLYSHDIKFLENSAQANNMLAAVYVNKALSIPENLVEQRRLLRLAVNHLSQATKVYPHLHNYWFDLGRVHMTLGNFKPAIYSFDMTYAKDTNFLQPLVFKAACYEQLKMPEKAFETYSFVISKPKPPLGAFTNLSSLYFVNGEIPSAININRKALNVYPNALEPIVNIGKAYLNTQQPDSAIFYFEKAYKISPDDKNLKYALYTLYSQKGDKTRAEWFKE